MNNSNQKTIKKLIKEYLKDGEERTIREIAGYLKEHGIEIEQKSSSLTNALHYLKNNEEKFINVSRGVYMWKNVKTESSTDSENSEFKNNDYDFSDFDTISPSRKKESELIVSIFENGNFALNTYLLKHFPNHEAEIKIKKDCTQLALIKNGISKINLGKNGRIKNYDIFQRIKDKKLAFPIYYVGKWDEKNEVWIGNLVRKNPNKPKKNR